MNFMFTRVNVQYRKKKDDKNNVQNKDNKKIIEKYSLCEWSLLTITVTITTNTTIITNTTFIRG